MCWSDIIAGFVSCFHAYMIPAGRTVLGARLVLRGSRIFGTNPFTMSGPRKIINVDVVRLRSLLAAADCLGLVGARSLRVSLRMIAAALYKRVLCGERVLHAIALCTCNRVCVRLREHAWHAPLLQVALFAWTCCLHTPMRGGCSTCACAAAEGGLCDACTCVRLHRRRARCLARESACDCTDVELCTWLCLLWFMQSSAFGGNPILEVTDLEASARFTNVTTAFSGLQTGTTVSLTINSTVASVIGGSASEIQFRVMTYFSNNLTAFTNGDDSPNSIDFYDGSSLNPRLRPSVVYTVSDGDSLHPSVYTPSTTPSPSPTTSVTRTRTQSRTPTSSKSEGASSSAAAIESVGSGGDEVAAGDVSGHNKPSSPIPVTAGAVVGAVAVVAAVVVAAAIMIVRRRRRAQSLGAAGAAKPAATDGRRDGKGRSGSAPPTLTPRGGGRYNVPAPPNFYMQNGEVGIAAVRRVVDAGKASEVVAPQPDTETPPRDADRKAGAGDVVAAKAVTDKGSRAASRTQDREKRGGGGGGGGGGASGKNPVLPVAAVDGDDDADGGDAATGANDGAVATHGGDGDGRRRSKAAAGVGAEAATKTSTSDVVATSTSTPASKEPKDGRSSQRSRRKSDRRAARDAGASGVEEPRDTADVAKATETENTTSSTSDRRKANDNCDELESKGAADSVGAKDGSANAETVVKADVASGRGAAVAADSGTGGDAKGAGSGAGRGDGSKGGSKGSRGRSREHGRSGDARNINGGDGGGGGSGGKHGRDGNDKSRRDGKSSRHRTKESKAVDGGAAGKPIDGADDSARAARSDGGARRHRSSSRRRDASNADGVAVDAVVDTGKEKEREKEKDVDADADKGRDNAASDRGLRPHRSSSRRSSNRRVRDDGCVENKEDDDRKGDNAANGPQRVTPADAEASGLPREARAPSSGHKQRRRQSRNDDDDEKPTSVDVDGAAALGPSRRVRRTSDRAVRDGASDGAGATAPDGSRMTEGVDAVASNASSDAITRRDVAGKAPAGASKQAEVPQAVNQPPTLTEDVVRVHKSAAIKTPVARRPAQPLSLPEPLPTDTAIASQLSPSFHDARVVASSRAGDASALSPSIRKRLLQLAGGGREHESLESEHRTPRGAVAAAVAAMSASKPTPRTPHVDSVEEASPRRSRSPRWSTGPTAVSLPQHRSGSPTLQRASGLKVSPRRVQQQQQHVGDVLASAVMFVAEAPMVSPSAAGVRVRAVSARDVLREAAAHAGENDEWNDALTDVVANSTISGNTASTSSSVPYQRWVRASTAAPAAAAAGTSVIIGRERQTLPHSRSGHSLRAAGSPGQYTPDRKWFM